MLAEDVPAQLEHRIAQVVRADGANSEFLLDPKSALPLSLSDEINMG